MSKEQIEEMAKDIACKIAWDEDEIPTVNCLETAKRLYCAGYRKQSEGEWIKIDEPLAETKYICSACNFNVMSWYGEHDGYTHERSVLMMRFCPNCGAHMRKEDEGK